MIKYLIYIILILAVSSCNFVGKFRYAKPTKKRNNYEIILGRKIKKEGREITQNERNFLNKSFYKQINLVSNKVIPPETIAKYDLLNLSSNIEESKYCPTSSISSFFRKPGISYSNYKFIINELNKDTELKKNSIHEDIDLYLLKQVNRKINNLANLAAKLKNKQNLNEIYKIQDLKIKGDHFNKKLSRYKLLHKKLSILASIDEIIERMPLYHPLPKSKIMSGYGERIHPKSGKKHIHSGIDLSAAEEEAFILASGKGIVKSISFGRQYGYYVVIDHGNKFQTLYAHMLYPIKVKKGQRIEAGQIIGYQGSTGNSTGPHLHFEVRKDNSPINPIEYISFASRCIVSRDK